MICNQCGAENRDDAKFCTKCGNHLQEGGGCNQQPVQEKCKQPEQQPTQQNPSWQQPPMQQNWNQPQQQWQQQVQTAQPQKGKGLLIAIIIVLAVAIMAVAGLIGYKLVISPFLESRNQQSVEEDKADEKDEDDEKIEDNKEEETTDAEEADIDIQALLTAQLNQDFDSRGNLIGSEITLITMNTWENFDENGIFGAAIIDLNDDGQEELIEVYMQTEKADYNTSCVYADVYAVENGEVSKVADQLLLNNGIGFDEQDTCIYLKKNGSGYNLVGDTYAMYCHWADGGDWEMFAYDCTDLAFTQVANYSMSGSAWDDDAPDKNLQAGKDAGLQVTEGLSDRPMILQDGDALMICNISNEVLSDYHDYIDDGYGLKENMEYGTMRFDSFTDDLFIPDESAGNRFFEDEDARYSSDEEDYILPDSADRILTEDDLSEIADSAQMLKLARNEIYARHGRMFKDETIQAYFDEKDWYYGVIDPDDFDEDMLSEIEKLNRDLIVAAEKKAN